MKIGMVTEWFLPDTGGAETHIYELSSYLVKEDYEVHVISGRWKGQKLPIEEKLNGFHVHRPVTWRWLETCQEQIGFITDAALTMMPFLEKMDIIHAHSTYFSPAAITAAIMLNKPCVLTLHWAWPVFPESDCRLVCDGCTDEKCRACERNKHGDLQYLVAYKRALTKMADAIVTTSNFERNKLLTYIPRILPERIHVVPNWVDTERFSEKVDPSPFKTKYNLSDSDKVCTYVGRIAEIKRLEDLLRAVPKVKDEVKNFKLVLAGRLDASKKYQEHLCSLAEELGIAENIIFAGDVPYQEVPMVYAASDVFVLPSLYESQGIVLLEALASGVPVVATRAGGIVEVIKDGWNGLLVDTKNPSQLADAILRLIQDSTLSKTLSKQGQVSVKEKYVIERLLPVIMGLYRKVLKEHH